MKLPEIKQLDKIARTYKFSELNCLLFVFYNVIKTENNEKQ